MDIGFFSTLSAVLRTGSLAAAAAEMNVTPSAVSMQMKQLEAQFGQALFDRTGRSVRPTPFARQLVEIMNGPLQRLDSLRRRTVSVVDGLIQIGIMESLQASVLPEIFHFQRERYPKLRIRAVRERSKVLIDMVGAGDIDAAVVVKPSNRASRRLTWSPLTSIDLVALAPPGYQKKGLKALAEDYTWIRFDTETSTGRGAASFVRKHTPSAPVMIELQSFPVLMAMVSAGHGFSVATQPDPRLLEAYPVTVLPLGPSAPSVEVSLVSRRSDAESRTLIAFQEAVAFAIEATWIGALRDGRQRRTLPIEARMSQSVSHIR